MPGATFLPIFSYGTTDAAVQQAERPQGSHVSKGDVRRQSSGPQRKEEHGAISRDGTSTSGEGERRVQPPHAEGVDAPGEHVLEAMSVERGMVTRAETEEKPRRTKKTKQAGTKEGERKRREQRTRVEAHVATLKAQRDAITAVQSLLILSGPITERQLAAAEQLLTRMEYGEVEEERAIVGACGHPCCGNQLPRDYANSGGRFKVGLGDRRVHRTEERGRFCSTACAANSRLTHGRLPLEREGLVPSLPLEEIVAIVEGKEREEKEGKGRETVSRTNREEGVTVLKGGVGGRTEGLEHNLEIREREVDLHIAQQQQQQRQQQRMLAGLPASEAEAGGVAGRAAVVAAASAVEGYVPRLTTAVAAVVGGAGGGGVGLSGSTTNGADGTGGLVVVPSESDTAGIEAGTAAAAGAAAAGTAAGAGAAAAGTAAAETVAGAAAAAGTAAAGIVAGAGAAAGTAAGAAAAAGTVAGAAAAAGASQSSVKLCAAKEAEAKRGRKATQAVQGGLISGQLFSAVVEGTRKEVGLFGDQEGGWEEEGEGDKKRGEEEGLGQAAGDQSSEETMGKNGGSRSSGMHERTTHIDGSRLMSKSSSSSRSGGGGGGNRVKWADTVVDPPSPAEGSRIKLEREKMKMRRANRDAVATAAAGAAATTATPAAPPASCLHDQETPPGSKVGPSRGDGSSAAFNAATPLVEASVAGTADRIVEADGDVEAGPAVLRSMGSRTGSSEGAKGWLDAPPKGFHLKVRGCGSDDDF